MDNKVKWTVRSNRQSGQMLKLLTCIPWSHPNRLSVLFCIVWLLEDSDANSIFRQEFWIFCICLKCQARDRVLDLVPDQYQKLNLKSFCPIPFSLMPSVLGKDSFEKKVVNFHNFGPDPPPLKVVKTPIFFLTPWSKKHFVQIKKNSPLKTQNT